MSVYVCDMMSTGFAGAEGANIPIGGTAAVFALGPVGLMAVAGAKFRGAGLIIGIDSVPKRQELGEFYGADIIVDPNSKDAVTSIIESERGTRCRWVSRSSREPRSRSKTRSR